MSANTIELDQSSLLVKFYSEVWGLNPTRANFCKLFWSVVFAPIGIAIFLFHKVIGIFDKLIPDSTQEHFVVFLERLDDKHLSKEQERRKNRASKINKWSARAESISNFFRNAWASNWVRIPVLILGGLVGLAVAAFIVWLIVNNIIDFLIYLGIVVGSLVLIGVLGATLNALDSKGTFKAIKASAKSFKYNTCPDIVVKKEE